MDKSIKIGLALAVALGLGLASYYYFSDPEIKPIGEIKNEEVPEKKVSLIWRELTKSALFQPRDSAAGFVFQNKIWVIGGLNGNSLVKNNFIKYWEAPHLKDVWYSENGADWSEVKTENIWPGRRSMSIVEFQNKLLMFGGWSPYTGYASDIWESIDGINWTKRDSKLPFEAREGQIVEIFQNKIFMVGGVNYDKRKVFNDVWYSEDGINWTLMTLPDEASWSGRWDHALAVYQDKLYLTAGMDLSGKSFNDVWVTENGIDWDLLTNSPGWQSRQGHSLFSWGGKLWIMGRLNDDKTNPGPNDIWNSEDGITWEKVGDLPWDGREDFSMVMRGDKIYIFGGMANDWTWRNDVWEGTLKIE